MSYRNKSLRGVKCKISYDFRVNSTSLCITFTLKGISEVEEISQFCDGKLWKDERQKIKKMRKVKRQWLSRSTTLDGVVRSSKTWRTEGTDHRSTWGREFKPLAITGTKSLGRVYFCFFMEYLCVYEEYQGGLQGWRIWKASEAIRYQTSKNVPMAKISALKGWKDIIFHFFSITVAAVCKSGFRGNKETS